MTSSTSAVRRPALLGLLWGALAGASPALQAELDGRAKTDLPSFWRTRRSAGLVGV